MRWAFDGAHCEGKRLCRSHLVEGHLCRDAVVVGREARVAAQVLPRKVQSFMFTQITGEKEKEEQNNSVKTKKRL